MNNKTSASIVNSIIRVNRMIEQMLIQSALIGMWIEFERDSEVLSILHGLVAFVPCLILSFVYRLTGGQLIDVIKIVRDRTKSAGAKKHLNDILKDFNY